MRHISFRLLLSIYAIIPIAVVVMLADTYAWSGGLRTWLPHYPETLLWYTLLFNLPHILASFFSFADKEYLHFYKSKLAWGTPIIALAALLLPHINLNLTVLIIVLYTMYHNISQQTGVSTIVMRARPLLYQYWRWTTILLALTLYFLVYPSIINKYLFPYRFPLLLILFAISIILTFFLVKKSKTHIGTLYTWSTNAIGGTCMLAYFLGYPIFTITILRFVHDLTAFVFYIVHDQNRNREVMHNVLYRNLFLSPRYFVIAIPLLGIILTYIVQGGGVATIVQVFFFLAVMHYYLDGFMWKNNSPHRQHLAFSS